MNVLNLLTKESTITNTKGGQYYATTYNHNLDFFVMTKRYMDEKAVVSLFANALSEDQKLAVYNLLYTLDIRDGKGERREFKLCFRYLCQKYPSLAVKVLPLIGTLGRYDYILEGMNTPIEKAVVALIKETLEKDIESEHPTLLAKWLPSHRNHNVNSSMAKLIMKRLGYSEKEYRKLLSALRNKIKIVEKSLTNKDYDNINFEEVPCKAMLRYQDLFREKITERYENYKALTSNGEAQINTKGLFSYEIIKKIIRQNYDEELLDLMWKNQKDLIGENEQNVLVVADTSGSMYSYDMLPISSALGLAVYFAERNKGIFQNHFITFSSRPKLQKLVGNSIVEKINNIQSIVSTTDVDKVFELLLNTAVKNKLNQNELPSHILLISDMEFDDGVMSKGGTNFAGWKKAFEDKGYHLPKIIFWNVAGDTRGIPAIASDDVVMVSGFSNNIFESIINIEDFSPVEVMINTLSKYEKMIDF